MMHNISFLKRNSNKSDAKRQKMATGQKLLLRRCFTVGIFFLILIGNADGIPTVANHYCYEVPGNANQARLHVRILPNDGPVYKVYSFDAANGDTSTIADRTTEVTCIKEFTGANKYTDIIEYDITVTATDPTHDCGISVVTDTDGITIVKFLYRIYAYSDTIISQYDASFMVICRMDDLTGFSVETQQLETAPGQNNIIRQQNTIGSILRIRDADTLAPVTSAKIGQSIKLSVEFFPQLQIGPDTYGSDFMIGFLGIDPISGTTSSELYVIVIPRYDYRTDISVTTKHGSNNYVITDGTPLKITLQSDLMGCSDGGVYEIEEKGVQIQTDMEVGLLACSTETGIADCYTAIPVDVTGKDYVTTSMYAADESAEFMIIAQEDGTTVDIDIPTTLAHTVTHNGTTTSAGGTVTVSLDKRMALDLAQTSDIADKSNVNGYHISADKPVSVVSGNRRYGDGAATEQLPPTTKFGTHYVLIPADPASDGRATTYIIQPVTTGDTVVTRYLSSTTSETHTVTYGEYLSLDVASAQPCELIADKAVMVLQVVNPPTGSGFQTSAVVMPSLTQWAPEYTFYHPDYKLSVAYVFRSPTHASHFRVNGLNPAPLDDATVLGPNEFFFGQNRFESDKYKLSMDTTEVYTTFMAIGYLSDGDPSTSSKGAAVTGLGTRMSDKDFCLKYGRINDLLDNDCDGLIDEERPNKIDDDGDGEIDEDTGAIDGYTIQENAGAVAISVKNCRVSADITFTDTSKTHAITDSDGCPVPRDGNIFVMDGEFVPQTGDNIGSGTQPKFLYSGPIEVMQYIDEPQLYFMCDIGRYCYSAADTGCTEICDSGKRRRRRDEEQKVNNITTNIRVIPYETESIKPAVKEIQADTTLQTCMGNTYVQLSFVSMGVLAMVSFFTAICFCCLFRKRHRKDKEREKKMYYSGRPNRF